jgi:hypothetical protein
VLHFVAKYEVQIFTIKPDFGRWPVFCKRDDAWIRWVLGLTDHRLPTNLAGLGELDVVLPEEDRTVQDDDQPVDAMVDNGGTKNAMIQVDLIVVRPWEIWPT